MPRALSIPRGHPAWSTKSKSLVNEFFIVRTVADSLNAVQPMMHHRSIRYGIVVKKKIGMAVLRNRIKRRIRAAFAQLDPSRINISAEISYIVVVRQSLVAHLPFLDVCTHLIHALKFYEK